MKRTVVVIRAGAVKLVLPNADIRADGTVWYNGVPLLDGEATGCLPVADATAAVKAQRWSDIPAQQYARLGTSPSGLRVVDQDVWQAEQDEAARPACEAWAAAHPGAAERARISALFAAAARRAEDQDDNNVMESMSMWAAAKRALAAWRETYPAEATEEQARWLRGKAADARALAAGALVYDCDGSLSRKMQDRRHDQFMAEAAEYDRQAEAMLAGNAR